MPKNKERELYASDLTINTTVQLEQFRNNVNNGNDYLGQTIELGSDIDLTGVSWVPIGTNSYPFKGTFNGKGYTISSMKISIKQNKNEGYAGFLVL